MAFLYRSKRFGYDNISVGNAAGEEQCVEGGTGRAANATSVLLERHVTSDQGSSEYTSPREFLIAHSSDGNETPAGRTSTGMLPDVTSDTSLWSSGTTFTTAVFPERVG